MVDAVGVTAAGHVDRCNPFRDQGFITAKTAVKHMAGLSGPEANSGGCRPPACTPDCPCGPTRMLRGVSGSPSAS